MIGLPYPRELRRDHLDDCTQRNMDRALAGGHYGCKDSDRGSRSKSPPRVAEPNDTGGDSIDPDSVSFPHGHALATALFHSHLPEQARIHQAGHLLHSFYEPGTLDR